MPSEAPGDLPEAGDVLGALGPLFPQAPSWWACSDGKSLTRCTMYVLNDHVHKQFFFFFFKAAIKVLYCTLKHSQPRQLDGFHHAGPISWRSKAML